MLVVDEHQGDTLSFKIQDCKELQVTYLKSNVHVFSVGATNLKTDQIHTFHCKSSKHT